MQLRLDSGADVTLISQEFWQSLRSTPKLKTGIKMNLHALTNSTKIVGYVVIHVFMRSLEGKVLDFEEEAYVVPGMRVPILLGEDFQKNYNILVHRHEGGVHLSLPAGGASHEIPAFNKPQVNKGFEVFKVETERKEPKGNPGPEHAEVQRMFLEPEHPRVHCPKSNLSTYELQKIRGLKQIPLRELE